MHSFIMAKKNNNAFLPITFLEILKINYHFHTLFRLKGYKLKVSLFPREKTITNQLKISHWLRVTEDRGQSN